MRTSVRAMMGASRHHSSSNLVFASSQAWGGGNVTELVFSPDGTELWAGTDVGGTKFWTGSAWRTRRSVPADRWRYVAGIFLVGSGRIMMAGGTTGADGVIAESTDAGMTWSELSTTYGFGANSGTLAYARPRGPGGHVFDYDTVNTTWYAATFDGVVRWTDSSPTPALIGLSGVECLGVQLLDENHLLVATATLGLVLVADCRSAATRVYPMSPTTWSTVHDVVKAPSGSTMKAYLAAGSSGTARLRAGYVTLAGTGQIDGPAVALTGSTYEIGCCIDLDNRATTNQTLISAWDTNNLNASAHQLRINSGGVLEYIARSNSTDNAVLTFAALPGGTGKLWMRVRRTAASGANNFTAQTSTDGITWSTLAQDTSSVTNNASATAGWSLGGTDDDAERISGKVYQGWAINSAGTQVLGPSLEGLISGDTSIVDIQGNTWSRAGTTTLEAGMVAIAPTFGTVGTGGTTRAACVDAARITSADRVVWGYVNPAQLPAASGDYAWVTRSDAGETETGSTVINASRINATFETGADIATPATSRMGTAGVSVDRDGITVIRVNPADSDNVLCGDIYQIYETTNVDAVETSITWSSKAVGYQVATLADGVFHTNGDILVPGPDNMVFANPISGNSYKVAISGVGGARSVARLGDLVVVGAGDRDTNSDGIIVWDYVSDFSAITWNTGPTLSGIQRVPGIHLIDIGSGVYRAVWYRDDVGFQRADFTISGTSWGAVSAGTGGPVVAQADYNHHTSIVGNSNALFALIRNAGGGDNGLYRSVDSGASWSQILSGTVNAAETLRRGFLAYDGANDILYVSDAAALRRIGTASGSPSATSLATATDFGPLALHPADSSLWVHREQTPSFSARLIRYPSPSLSSTNTDVANDDYRETSPLATSLNIHTDGTILITGQGTGTGPG